MINIKDIREKEVMLGYIFYVSKQPITRKRMFDWWSTYSVQDFKVNRKALFTVIDDELIYKPKIKDTHLMKEDTLAAYQEVFEKVYSNVKQMAEKYDKDKFISARCSIEKDNLKKMDKVIKEYKIDARVEAIGGDNWSATKLKELRKFRLLYHDLELKVGTCDQIIAYIRTEAEKIPKVA